MTVFGLVLRYFRARWVLNALTSLAVAIGIALIVATTAIGAATKTSVMQAAGGFQLLVTAKGSPVQAVLSAMFFLDVPIGNVPLDLYRQIRDDPGVDMLVPLNLGDNYRGHYIVGTTPDYFVMIGETIRRPVEVRQGRLFEQPFEAVLGATTTRNLGLSVGDTFVGMHGFIDLPEELAHVHEEDVYEIVGILDRTNTPADRAIFTSAETVWKIHDQVPPQDWRDDAVHAGANPHHVDLVGQHEHADAHDDEHQHDEPDRRRGHNDDHAHEHDHDHEEAAEVTAFFVKGESYMDLLRLGRAIDESPYAQAIVPGRVVAQLFEYFEVGETVVLAVSWLAIGVAFFTIMISVLAATIERQREIATMRVLGASRGTVAGTVLLESGLIAAIGAVVGVVLGRVAAYVLAGMVERTSGLQVELAPLVGSDLLMVGIGIALGLVAGLVPAYVGYRQDVAKGLSPSY